MNDARIFYAGPTITGVATRNTVYDGTPEPLAEAIRAAPYLAGLCLSAPQVPVALSQSERRQGGIYQLYAKAVRESENIRAAIQERSETNVGV